MSLEKVNLPCISKLDAQDALRLSWLTSEMLVDCNIADIGAGVSGFWKLIAEISRGCDIVLVDTIYASSEVYAEAIERTIQDYQKSFDLIVSYRNWLPFEERNHILFSQVQEVHDKAIAKLLWAKEKYRQEPESDENDNVLYWCSEFPENMKWTMQYVCMTSIFYEALDPAKFLEEIDSYLADDGKIILIEPRDTYKDGGKFNVDSMLEFLRKIWKEWQQKIWIRIISEDHKIFSCIEIQKWAYKNVKFPQNKPQ